MKIKNILIIFYLVLVFSICISFNLDSSSVLALNTTSDEDSYQFVKEWGSYGYDIGKFNNPGGIAIDSEDNIYVADSYNYRIQKFDSNGNFLKEWKLVNAHGSRPVDIFIENEERLNVLYGSANYGVPSGIQQFDYDGNLISDTYGELGDLRFGETHTTAINSTGYKFYLETDSSNIQIFSPIVNNLSTSKYNETLKTSLPIGITDQI